MALREKELNLVVIMKEVYIILEEINDNYFSDGVEDCLMFASKIVSRFVIYNYRQKLFLTTRAVI